MRLMVSEHRGVGFFYGILKLFGGEENEVHYIGGAEVLPPPLEEEEETYCIHMLNSSTAEEFRKTT